MVRARHRLATKEVPPAEHRTGLTERDQFLRVGEQRLLRLRQVPVHPRDLVVLRVGVVVAQLRPPQLVAMREHWHTLGKSQRREKAPHQPVAQLDCFRIVRLALMAPVPAEVVAVTVLVVLTVRVVVLLLVAHQITQRVAVVCGDEIDARVHPTVAFQKDVARAGKPACHLGHLTSIAAPELSHCIAVLPVPLRPAPGKIADLIAARSHVPRFRNQLDTGKRRVLMHDVEERGELVHIMQLAREYRREIEPESVHMHVLDPVAQRVHDELNGARVLHVERVTGPGKIGVETRVLRLQPVVRRVINPLHRQRGTFVVALARVIVHDVENHLEPGGMECLHHGLELFDLEPKPARCVAHVGSKKPDGIVAPIVRQATLGQMPVHDELMHRQQLEGSDAQRLEIFEHRSAA